MKVRDGTQGFTLIELRCFDGGARRARELHEHRPARGAAVILEVLDDR